MNKRGQIKPKPLRRTGPDYRNVGRGKEWLRTGPITPDQLGQTPTGSKRQTVSCGGNMDDKQVGIYWATRDTTKEPWLVAELIIKLVEERAYYYDNNPRILYGEGETALTYALRDFGIDPQEYDDYLKARAETEAKP